MPDLFTSIRIGDFSAKNRIFMAPLTRARAEKDAVPVPMMVEYYAQRAESGLIISEATGISREGLGWPYAPGIWSDEQVDAWKAVTKAVHDKGGKIVCQLWHMGRAVHSSTTGRQPVSASETTAPGDVHTYDGKQPYEQARALTKQDISRILEDYENAARNALRAGFDGVQVHAANGYLIDQFLRDSSNHRNDEYGGSPRNRLRFLFEVMQRVISVVGAEKTGVRFSPNGDSQGVIDSAPETIFIPAAEEMERLGVAWIELREASASGTFLGQTDQPKLSPQIRKAFNRVLVLNQDYSFEMAQKAVQEGLADAISFGRQFIANPDLPRRFEEGLPIQKDDMATWYSRGEHGYLDYPSAQRG